MLIASGDTHVGFGAGWPARGRPDPPPATDRGVRSPIPHGFIGQDYPALGHLVFDIAVAPAEAVTEPRTMTDDAG